MTISTAAWLTDAVPRPMAVSVRARLPTRRAWRNSRSSVERTPPSSCGELPRGADLAEDLALAEHRRVETGGDLEQVAGRGLVVLAVEVRVQLVGDEAAELAEEVADVGVGAVEALGDGVDLGAVARAEHGDLAEVVPAGEAGDRLGDVVGGDRQPLEDRQRSGAVVDTDDDDRTWRTPAYALAPRRDPVDWLQRAGAPGAARSS